MTKSGDPSDAPKADVAGHEDTLAADGTSLPGDSGGHSPPLAHASAPASASSSGGATVTIRGVGPGDKLGRYELGDELGAGGMASVFRARDTELRRDVAVKVLFPHLAKKQEITRRFQREARAAAVLEHPNILRVYDVGSSAGTPPFIVMELVRGQSLREVAEAHGPMLSELVACIGALLCDALAVAHAGGIVHRDVKPGNVMLADDGRLLLADFGVARLDDDDSLVTKSGALLGTPSFMAPEQALGNPVDARSDLYSVGASLYQLATGGLPFSGPTAKIVADASRGAAPPAIRRRPAVGVELSRLIERMMSPDPDKRPSSATAAAAELRAIASAGGLTDAVDEVRTFAADRPSWEKTKKPAIVDKLVSRARTLRSKSLPQALALVDRALALEPEHAAAQTLASELQAPDRRRTIVIVGLAALALSLAGVWMLTHRSHSISRSVSVSVSDSGSGSDSGSATDSDSGSATDSGSGSGSVTGSVTDSATATASAAPDLVDARTLDARERAPRDAGSGAIALRIDASPMLALPIDAGAVAIDAGAMITAPIDAPPAPTTARITFAFDTWCELVVDNIKRGRADRELAIELDAGHHTATCSQGPGLEIWTGSVDVKANTPKRVAGTLIEPVDVLISVGDSVRIDNGKDAVPRGTHIKLRPGSRRLEVLVGGKVKATAYVRIPRVPSCTLRDRPQLDCYP